MGEVAVVVPEEGIAKLVQSMTIKQPSLQGDTSILKPRSDKRNYRRIVLANAMQVLLVSDPETDMAAASMDVHVGYFCDPKELPGLAHFLEHMLFYSSEKFPQEGSFTKFLGEHAGSSNAYTAALNTNFRFDVGADHLEDALDRFAQFFICPLLADDAVSREIRAVDSENSRNLKSDAHRLSQLDNHFTSRDHPQHKFDCGNLQTLEEIPKAKGIDTRAEVLKFYKDHYSSNLMCLVLYGKQNLDQLQVLAEDTFSVVKNLEHEVVQIRGEPCSAEHLNILVKGVAVKEQHTLKLSWPVKPSLSNYREAPWQHIGRLVNHEGHGSLLALLKELGWAYTLTARESNTLHFSFFVVYITLTDAGQDQLQEIIGLIFQYLRIIQKDGTARWIFEEMQAVRDMVFNFQDKYSPYYYTSKLAYNMRIYPVEDWLACDLPRVFDRRLISEAIQQLTPERVRIFSLSNRHSIIATEIEPWYGTKLISEKIDSALIQKWTAADVVHPRLHMPARNEFIPRDFSILNAADSAVHVPVILKSTKMSRLWYKSDIKFRTPKASIGLKFNCPECNYSPEAAVLAVIFAGLVTDELNAYAYHARNAGLHFRFYSSEDGFIFFVYGFNNRLIDLANEIIAMIVNFQVKDDRFNVRKEIEQKNWTNLKFQRPLAQARGNCQHLLLHKSFYYTDLLEVVPSLTADDLRRMVPRFFSRVFLELFVAGNLTSKQAEDFLEHVERSLSNGLTVKSKPVFSSELMEKRVIRMENGAYFTYPTIGRNRDDENSGLYLYLQLGQDETQLNIMVEILVSMMYQEFFHQLRTVEQLGYEVSLQSSVLYGVRGIQFSVQSTVKDPEALELRVEDFLENFAETLENMSEEKFQTNVKSCINVKLEKDKNLWDEIGTFWFEIMQGTLKFNRAEMEAAALRNLDKQAVIDFYRTFVQRDAPRRRKLSCQVYGNKHLQEYKAMRWDASCNTAELSGVSEKEPEGISNSHPHNGTNSLEKEPDEISDSDIEEGTSTIVKKRDEMPQSDTEEESSATARETVKTIDSHTEEGPNVIVEESEKLPSSDPEGGEGFHPGAGRKLQKDENDQSEKDTEATIGESVHNDTLVTVTEGRKSDDHKEKSKSRVQLIYDRGAFKRSQSLYSSLWSAPYLHTRVSRCKATKLRMLV